jgi:signal transduction histidine kinase
MAVLLHPTETPEGRAMPAATGGSPCGAMARELERVTGERRQLERNLHDGAQQRLVSLSLQLRLLGMRLEPGSEAATLLAGAQDELAQSLAELRELAHGLHPAVLTDHGLAVALRSLADRAPVPVDVDVVLARRPPAAVEVAAYYFVSESLANIAKYAAATSAEVRVVHEDGRLIVEVTDDGVGGADPGAGSGLRGLGDRLAALGGELDVHSPLGLGTRVRATIPCAGGAC